MPRHQDMRLPDEAGRVVSRYLELVDEALPDRVEARFDRSSLVSVPWTVEGVGRRSGNQLPFAGWVRFCLYFGARDERAWSSASYTEAGV